LAKQVSSLKKVQEYFGVSRRVVAEKWRDEGGCPELLKRGPYDLEKIGVWLKKNPRFTTLTDREKRKVAERAKSHGAGELT
jgi:hypothetical protein